MGWFDYWNSLWGSKHVAAAATELVHHTREHVWEVVWHRVMTMGEAEAKGYTRARSAPILAAHADETLARYPQLGCWAREPLMEEAAERMAHHVWYRAQQAKLVRPRQRRAA